MSLTYIATATATDNASGTTLDCTSTLNLSAGDVLLCGYCYYGESSTVAIASTAPDNSLTVETQLAQNSVRGGMAYLLTATENASATFRLTLGTAGAYRSIRIYQFRPDTGETSTRAAGTGANGVSASPASGNISWSGTDVAVMGAGFNEGIDVWTAMQIGAESPTASHTGVLNTAYRLYTTTGTNIQFTGTCSNTKWVSGIVAISAAAAGPEKPALMNSMLRRRRQG